MKTPDLTGKRVLCGFSGGADSLYLLLTLKERSRKERFFVEAVHFNHGFRGAESDGDEAFCRTVCERETVPFHAVSLRVPDRKREGEGDEEASRRLRLEEWCRLADENTLIALGHHAGDQLENLFLRLCRGSNTGGLTNLRPLSRIGKLRFWRPLLSLTPEFIRAELKKRGEVWRTDSTNLQEEYARNFFRNRILPQITERLPYAEKGLLRSLQVLAMDADFLNLQAEEEALPSEPDWKDLHPALLPRVLRIHVRKKTGVEFIPDHDFCEAFTSLLHTPKLSGEKKLFLPGTDGLFFRFQDGHCPLLRTETTVPEAGLWDLKKDFPFGEYLFHAEPAEAPELIPDCRTLFLPEALIRNGVTIRTKHPGDRLKTEGREIRLSKILSDCKCSPEERETLPLLLTADGSELLWVPGIRASVLTRSGTGPWLKLTCPKKKDVL